MLDREAQLGRDRQRQERARKTNTRRNLGALKQGYRRIYPAQVVGSEAVKQRDGI